MQCADKQTIMLPVAFLIPKFKAFPGRYFFILIIFTGNFFALNTVLSVEKLSTIIISNFTFFVDKYY